MPTNETSSVPLPKPTPWDASIPRHHIPIANILVEDRQRKDLGDIVNLAKSMFEHGLIQPIVLNQQNRLIAGGRRLAAAESLGWTDILCVYMETLSEDHLTVLELEENVRRKDMVWTEKCLAVRKIHLIRQREAALASNEWTNAQTGELLGMSQAPVTYCLQIAKALLMDPVGPLWECDNMLDAIKYQIRVREDAELAELARRSIPNIPITPGSAPAALIPAVPLTPAEDAELGITPDPERPTLVVPLSSMITRGDCISVLATWPPECVDHCITDPPYGIDMDMLNQQNPHGTMLDIDRVEEEHDVESNEALFVHMFPAVYRVLKPDAFFVLWCDIMQWQRLYDLAIATGFKVQRWPLVWNKTHTCMNQCAHLNFTKDFEIAMVCRKGRVTLADTSHTSVISCSRERYKGYHPFFKPFELWEFIFDHVALEGQTVLDPFCGEGSCLMAALGARLKPLGIELNEKHYNNALENIKGRYLVSTKNVRFE